MTFVSYDKLYNVFTIAFKMMILNLMFICSTLLGLIVFGLGPSLVAGHEFFRKFVTEDIQEYRIRDYWQTYFHHFIKGNLLFLPLFLVFCFLLFDTQLIARAGLSHSATLMLLIVFGIVQIALISVCECIFPMYLFYKMRMPQYFYQASLYMLKKPLILVCAGLWSLIVVTVSLWQPGLLALISIGAWLFGNSAIIFRSFAKNEQLLSQKEG